MRPTEPLPLHHSWPLFEWERRFDLGRLIDISPTALATDGNGELARRGIGVWGCELGDNSLSWSAAVYEIFGLPRDARVRREDAVALYAEDSRAAMERLRVYAIKHRRGFTLDAQIRPAVGRPRWMRLIAAPVCDGDMVVRLQGLKLAL